MIPAKIRLQYILCMYIYPDPVHFLICVSNVLLRRTCVRQAEQRICFLRKTSE